MIPAVHEKIKKVKKLIKIYRHWKKSFDELPTEINEGIFYDNALKQMFGEREMERIRHSDNPPMMRICYMRLCLGMFYDDYYVFNGRFVKVCEAFDVFYAASLDLEWSIKYIITHQCEVIKSWDKREIYTGYAQSLLHKILQKKPDFRYVKKRWKIPQCAPDEIDLEMTKIISNYIQITTKQTIKDGKLKTRSTRKHKESVGIHI